MLVINYDRTWLDRFNKEVGTGADIILILVNFLNANLHKEIIAIESLFKEW